MFFLLELGVEEDDLLGVDGLGFKRMGVTLSLGGNLTGVITFFSLSSSYLLLSKGVLNFMDLRVVSVCVCVCFGYSPSESTTITSSPSLPLLLLLLILLSTSYSSSFMLNDPSLSSS